VCFVSFVVKKIITTKSTKVTKFLNPRAVALQKLTSAEDAREKSFFFQLADETVHDKIFHL